MATTIRQRTVTVPANTAESSPYVAELALPQEQITRIDLEVPPGPSGLMGFYLALSGVQLIPWDSGQWIVWDNHYDSYPLDNYPTTGDWSVVAYNLDAVNDHEIYLRFFTDPLAQPKQVGPVVNIITQPPTNTAMVLG